MGRVLAAVLVLDGVQQAAAAPGHLQVRLIVARQTTSRLYSFGYENSEPAGLPLPVKIRRNHVALTIAVGKQVLFFAPGE